MKKHLIDDANVHPSADDWVVTATQQQAVENDYLMSPHEQAMWLENTANQIENLNRTIRHLGVKAEAYDALVKLINPPDDRMGYAEDDVGTMRRRAKNILGAQQRRMMAAIEADEKEHKAAVEKRVKAKAAAAKRAATLAAKKAQPTGDPERAAIEKRIDTKRAVTAKLRRARRDAQLEAELGAVVAANIVPGADA